MTADPQQSPAPVPGPTTPSGSGDGPPDPGGAATSPTPDTGQADLGAQNYTDAASQIGGRHLALQTRLQKSALVDLNAQTLNGPVQIGDRYELFFGSGDSQVRARKLTAEEKASFISTPDLERLRDSLGDQPLVVLNAPRGYGKGAALIWALGRELPDDAMVLILDPATDLASFSCTGFPQQSVLILQDLPDSSADRLDTYTAERIESELREHCCRLGITTASKAVRLATASTRILVARLTTRPAPREVFTRHLSDSLLGTGLSPRQVEQWPGITDLLADELDDSCSLADAARLAMLLFRARDEPDKAAARVRALLTEYADEEVARWFRGLDDLASHCMAISLAVLNGLSREVISANARSLERLILPPSTAPNAPPPGNPFALNATASPAALRARVEREEIDTEHGPVYVQTMTYRERGYPGRVLRYVWREFDAGRAALCSWLQSLGRSPNLDVRVRAATAVGVLACDSMDYLYQQVIIRWARDRDAEVRASAAIALGPAADDRRLGPTVRSVVAEWARPGGRWQLRASAARVYGGTFGLSSPTSSFRALASLAESDGLDVTAAISASYCELLLDGTAALAIRVLGEVASLASDRERRKQATGRLAAVGMTYLRGTPGCLEDRVGRRAAAWPSLLLLALSDPAAAEITARLWQLSLHDPDIGPLVAESLDEWAEAAEGDSRMRPEFAKFTAWIGADQRSRRLVLRRAQMWKDRDGRAPETGQDVISYLS